MRKIMFSDKFGLTEAVLSGRKTQTRRIYKDPANSYGGLEIENNSIITFDIGGNEIVTLPQYKVGEVVAVAQAYKDLGELYNYHAPKQTVGWANKMFVRADLMPHQIRITDVRIERLQEISDADCMAEGLIFLEELKMYYFEKKVPLQGFYCNTPREAYAALIDKISGRGTWDENPYVYVYEFELIK